MSALTAFPVHLQCLSASTALQPQLAVALALVSLFLWRIPRGLPYVSLCTVAPGTMEAPVPGRGGGGGGGERELCCWGRGGMLGTSIPVALVAPVLSVSLGILDIPIP